MTVLAESRPVRKAVLSFMLDKSDIEPLSQRFHKYVQNMGMCIAKKSGLQLVHRTVHTKERAEPRNIEPEYGNDLSEVGIGWTQAYSRGMSLSVEHFSTYQMSEGLNI
ncbi:hypothetical protein KCV03_g45, partial [Aureobasidium melanogenum]